MKFHQLDIDAAASVEKLRDFLKETYGGLDVLINNAAIAFKSNATESMGHQVSFHCSIGSTSSWNSDNHGFEST